MNGLKQRIVALFNPKREVIQIQEDQSADERRQIRESLERIQAEVEVISRQFGEKGH